MRGVHVWLVELIYIEGITALRVGPQIMDWRIRVSSFVASISPFHKHRKKL